MNRLSQLSGRHDIYVGYVMAGDGGISRTLESALALVKGGVSVLEIGVPFSDPIADGPVIQAASIRSLNANTTISSVLQLIAALRSQIEIPIVLFSYLNPILAVQAKNSGKNRDFYELAALAGVDGCLIVDLPPEESSVHYRACERVGIDPIILIAPSTPVARIERLQHYAKGFLYYVCRQGVTGMKSELPQYFSEKIATIKALTSLPVVAGFGIADQKQAALALQHADGFVVGSLFVDAIAKGMSAEELTRLAASIDPRANMRKAIDAK